jgi:hypothetical protein
MAKAESEGTGTVVLREQTDKADSLEFDLKAAQLAGQPSPRSRYEVDRYLSQHRPELEPGALFEQVKDKPAMQTEFWRQALNGIQIGDFEVKVPEILPNSYDDKPNPRIEEGLDSVSVFATFHKEGEKVGDINFLVAPDVNYQLEFCLGIITLKTDNERGQEKDNSGQGFGKAFFQQIETICRQSEINKISLHAVNQGTYVWSRLGFDLDPRGEDKCQFEHDYKNYKQNHLNLIGEALIDKAERSNLDAETKTEIKARIKKAGKLKSIADFAELSKGLQVDGQEFNFAKAFLPGIEWNGIKFLD